MPPLKPGHISLTPEEEAEIEADLATATDTWEATGELIPMTEAAPHIVAWYLAEQARRRAAGKTRVTIRLDADVVSQLRAGGPGWQTRANDMLRHAVLGA